MTYAFMKYWEEKAATLDEGGKEIYGKRYAKTLSEQ